jgi:CBS domain-containing protein
MLNKLLISHPAPPFHPDETVATALDLMEEWKVEHWPIVAEGVCKGLLSEEILLDAKNTDVLANLNNDYLPFWVSTEEHFLYALRVMTERKLTVLPVVDEAGEYIGVMMQKDLLDRLAIFTGAQLPGGVVVLQVSPLDYSPGELSRLVETNDAQIRQLNTQIDEVTGMLMVTIRINKQEISDIIATFQRYDYRIVYFAGEEQYENELRRNYHHLLHYIEM